MCYYIAMLRLGSIIECLQRKSSSYAADSFQLPAQLLATRQHTGAMQQLCSCAAAAVQTHCHSCTDTAHAAAQISHSVTLNYMCGTPQPNNTPGFGGQSPASAEQLDTQRSSPLYSTGDTPASLVIALQGSHGSSHTRKCRRCLLKLQCNAQCTCAIRPPDTPQAPCSRATRHTQCMDACLVLALHPHSTAPSDLTASFHSNSKPLISKQQSVAGR